MPPLPRPRDWLSLARHLSLIASVAAAVIAAVELAVWFTQPGWIPHDSVLYAMKANSALVVLLLGAGAVLLLPGRTSWRLWTTRAAAMLALVVTVLTLFEYSSGRSVGVDIWLATDHTVDAGRMAAQSAATLTLAGLALLTLTVVSGPGRWLPDGMLLAAAVTLEMMTIGFFDHATLLYDVTGQSPAAPQSAIAQWLVVAALVCARASFGATPVLTGQSRGSAAVRVILPAIIALPLALGQLRMAGEAAGLFAAPYGYTFFATAQTLILGGCVYGFARSMNRLDERYRRERQQRQEYERLVAVCAWTRRVRWQGRWLAIEDFLKERFNLTVSHGISDEALARQLAELESDTRALSD